MKSCYTLRVPESRKPCILDLSEHGLFYEGVTWIHRINVPKEARGNGYGSQLLQQLLDDADAEGVTLGLEIGPSDGLGYEELEAWYMRRGFQPIELELTADYGGVEQYAWVRVPTPLPH